MLKKLMNDLELAEKVMEKKEFSKIPLNDVLKILNSFDNNFVSDEEKIKKTRDLLRRIYSGFGGKKLLVWKDKTWEEILKKHLSTRERFEYYGEIYGRLLKGFEKCSVIDLGSGVNGFSYNFFEKIGKTVNYLGVEAVGQLSDLTQEYFEKNKLNAKSVHLSLFDSEEVFKLIKKTKIPRVIFLFKVVDSLEKVERNYTLKFILDLKKLGIKRFVISFATESWFKRKKFFVQRNWLINFIKDNFEFVDDFNLGGERYLVFE
jgi:hypothetical protein